MVGRPVCPPSGDVTVSAVDAAGDVTVSAVGAAGGVTVSHVDAAGDVTASAADAAGDVAASAVDAAGVVGLSPNGWATICCAIGPRSQDLNGWIGNDLLDDWVLQPSFQPVMSHGLSND